MNNKEGIRTENGLIPDSPADAFVLVISSLLFFFVFSHPVTYSDFREDVFWLGGIILDLASYICHINTQDFIERIEEYVITLPEF